MQWMHKSPVRHAPIVSWMLFEQRLYLRRTFALQGIYNACCRALEIGHVDASAFVSVGRALSLCPWDFRGEQFGIGHMLPVHSGGTVGGSVQSYFGVVFFEPLQGVAKQLASDAYVLEGGVNGNIRHRPAVRVFFCIELFEFRNG